MSNDDGVRYLVYRAPARGQGIGSMMNGLAAALVLAARHDRRPCVRWHDFGIGFRWTLPCPSPEEYYVPAGDGLQTAVIDASGVIEMWSFGASTSGPEASALLQSSRRIVIMYGDGGSVDVASATPLALPALPLPSLASALSPPWPVVAHLRLGDPSESARRGIFAQDGAIERLAEQLPEGTLVLTDSAEVHGAMCGGGSQRHPRFACPSWGVLPHSAERSGPAAGGGRRGADPDAKHNQTRMTLLTWADWWTIHAATSHVLHTPSAFSTSATKFSNATACALHDMASLQSCAARARGAQSALRQLMSERAASRHEGNVLDGGGVGKNPPKLRLGSMADVRVEL